MNPLINKHCRPTSSADSALNLSQIGSLRQYTLKWQFCADENQLFRTLHFDNYAHTMAFVNAVARIAEQHDHHPEMWVSYKRCKVGFYTHTVGGLTENDFICAALIDVQFPNLD